MITMEIKKANSLNDDIRETIGEIFVDAFFDSALKYISKNKEHLIKIFAPMFVLEHFYVAVVESKIAGIIACNDRNNSCVNIKKNIIVKYIGKFKGFFIYHIIKNSFSNYSKKFKINTNEKTAVIEILATNSKFRRMGIASSLMDYVIAFPDFNHYVLEVIDINKNAIELYKKYGFKETHRKKFNQSKEFDYFVYMKYSK